MTSADRRDFSQVFERDGPGEKTTVTRKGSV